MCFDAARGRWYMPDLSKGNVAMLVESGSEWPVSGDGIAKARAKARATTNPGGLIALIDWESLEDDDE